MDKTRKKYFTYKIGIVIPIPINGAVRIPKFVWSYIAKRGEFSTSDPDMQKAIESSIFFKRGIIKLDPYSIRTTVESPKVSEPITSEPSEPAKTPEPEMTTVESAKNYKEAKEYMASVGIDVLECKNIYVLRKIAKENNLIFPGV